MLWVWSAGRVPLWSGLVVGVASYMYVVGMVSFGVVRCGCGRGWL